VEMIKNKKAIELDYLSFQRDAPENE